MNKKLLYITNIPTPYRNSRFNALSLVCAEHGLLLEVLYMNESEPDRAWTINPNDMKHRYKVFSKSKVRMALGMWMHFSPKLQAYLMRCDYDIAILGGLASPAHFMASLLLKTSKFNLLSVESNLSSIGNHSGIATKVKAKLMRRFTHFQVTGEKATEFIRHYVPEVKSENVITLPNVINESLFERADSATLPQSLLKCLDDDAQAGLKRVLIPARLIEEKGLFPFFESLRKDDPLMIYLAGDGPLRGQLEDYVKTNQLKVRFLGAQSPETTAKLMKSSDFLCLPSKSDPSPLSVIEACYCALPILASKNIGNFHDVIRDGVNGWGFEFANPQSTRAGIECLINLSDTERRGMAQKARERFEDTFRTHKVLERYVSQLKAISGI